MPLDSEPDEHQRTIGLNRANSSADPDEREVEHASRLAVMRSINYWRDQGLDQTQATMLALAEAMTKAGKASE